jgi:hypothetical protein
VKIVELELKIEVNEDIKAAIIQANVKPRIAEKRRKDLFSFKRNKSKIYHWVLIEAQEVDMQYHYNHYDYDKLNSIHRDQYNRFHLYQS